jgi:hypothetical protein
MKYVPNVTDRGHADTAEPPPHLGRPTDIVGRIPGLERLLPGHYRPGSTVRNRYGTWILPVCFKGKRLSAINDGAMIGRPHLQAASAPDI